MHLLEMRVEDGLEAPALGSAGDPREPRVEPARPSSQRDRGDHEHEHGHGQARDEHAEIGLDQRVEVDPRVLQWAARV